MPYGTLSLDTHRLNGFVGLFDLNLSTAENIHDLYNYENDKIIHITLSNITLYSGTQCSRRTQTPAWPPRFYH